MANGIHLNLSGADAKSWRSVAEYVLKNVCRRPYTPEDLGKAEKALIQQNLEHLEEEKAYSVNLNTPAGADHRMFSWLQIMFWSKVEIYADASLCLDISPEPEPVPVCFPHPQGRPRIVDEPQNTAGRRGPEEKAEKPPVEIKKPAEEPKKPKEPKEPKKPPEVYMP